MQKDYMKELVEVVKTLRSENGCPWDRAQTHQTIRKNMLEEAYEAVEAIDENNMNHLKEELGDVLLQVLLHSQMADEEDEFNLQDVAKMLYDKLIFRHPHVFGEAKAKDANEALANWEKLKGIEKQERKRTLDGIPSTLPSLSAAYKISKKVVDKGFEWENRNQLIDCYNGEIEEYKKAQNKQDKEEEFGDVLFTLVNIARWDGLDPDKALAFANRKFIKRFNKLEEIAEIPLKELNFEQYDALWKKAKKLTENQYERR